MPPIYLAGLLLAMFVVAAVCIRAIRNSALDAYKDLVESMLPDESSPCDR